MAKEDEAVLTAGAEAQKKDRLLSAHERNACEFILTQDTPQGKYAVVLLALDEGVTQVEAGRRAGLSARQVRYWRDKFLQQRLDIFPDDLLETSPTEDEGEAGQEPEAAAEPVVKDSKSKKGKKGKKGKKDKKGKKNKKGKKDKKSK